MGKDLDQLAGVITGALQVVDEEQPGAGAWPGPGATDSGGDREGKRKLPATVELDQDQDQKSVKGQDLDEEDTLRGNLQGRCFSLLRKRVIAEKVFEFSFFIFNKSYILCYCLYSNTQKTCSFITV